jgi:flagellar basal body rod protein FlgG
VTTNGVDSAIAMMASAMSAQELRLETAAHNLANTSTGGFRKTRTALRLTPGGVVAENRRDERQGGLKLTGRAFDLALVGAGAFRLAGPHGVETTRAGAFERDAAGYLADPRGCRLLGEHGLVRVPAGATVATDGTVRAGSRVVDRLPLAPGASVRSGALEESNADAVGEMIVVLGAQRAFETAEKTLAAVDQVRAKDAQQSAKVSG